MTAKTTPREREHRFKLLCVIACAVLGGFVGGRLVEAREPYPRVHKLLATGKTVAGETISYPSASPARLTAAVVALQPGEETGWHRHGVPVFGYVLEGELTVDYGNKGQRTYHAGEGFAEAIETAHNGHNTGVGMMRVLALFMGADGLPTTIAVKKQ